MGTPLCPTCVVNCHSSLLLAFVRSALLTLGCLQFEHSCNAEFSGELGQLGSELILYLSVCLCRPKMNELAFVQQPAIVGPGGAWGQTHKQAIWQLNWIVFELTILISSMGIFSCD